VVLARKMLKMVRHNRLFILKIPTSSKVPKRTEHSINSLIA